MTQPNPSAESTETTEPAESATETTTQPTPFDPSSLSPEAQAYLKTQVEGAGYYKAQKAATAAKEETRQALLAEFAQKLGLTEPADPEAAAAQLAERAEAAEARIWTLGVKDAVYNQAADAGANAKLVYNSNEFRDMLDDLTDADADTSEFRAAVLAKLRQFIAANPEYATAAAPTGPRPDPSQGARGAGPDLDSRIAEAKAKGDWRAVISLENQKLTKTT